MIVMREEILWCDNLCMDPGDAIMLQKMGYNV